MGEPGDSDSRRAVKQIEDGTRQGDRALWRSAPTLAVMELVEAALPVQDTLRAAPGCADAIERVLEPAKFRTRLAEQVDMAV